MIILMRKFVFRKKICTFEKLCIVMKQLLLKIASILYGLGLRVRHWMFDVGMLHSEKYDIPVLCVGNITVGGTGKTPAVEMLVGYYAKTHNVAVVSRGYGRKTKGYLEVSVDDSYIDVGDEPLQIKRKFPNVPVIVCEKRAYAIERIREQMPDVNMIIMDDGFQHRFVQPYLNIIMVDASRPVERDHLLPYGQLRDTISSLHRAHYFIVTKCPDDMTPIQMRIQHKVLTFKPSQQVFFTRFKRSVMRTLIEDRPMPMVAGSKVIAMSGIGNSEVFNEDLRSRFNVVETLDFEDHHTYRLGDLALMQKALERNPDAVIITTEKDAVKLFNSRKIPAEVSSRILYESVELAFVDGTNEFFQKLDKDIKQHNNDGYIRGC